MWEEVEESYRQIERARGLGYRVLVVTVDSALGRIREHNERNGFAFPFRPNPRAFADMLLHPRWLPGTLLRTVMASGPPRNANYPECYPRVIARRGTAKPKRHVRMTWDEIRRLRDLWDGPLLVKSVLSPEDALQAMRHGADGIVVSNHGGRAMDSAVATIDALPRLRSVVGRDANVILDSGVRRGSDVIKAIARGADAAFVGRPPLYGIAVGGQAGAERVLSILSAEFETTMGYLGRRSWPRSTGRSSSTRTERPPTHSPGQTPASPATTPVRGGTRSPRRSAPRGPGSSGPAHPAAACHRGRPAAARRTGAGARRGRIDPPRRHGRDGRDPPTSARDPSGY